MVVQHNISLIIWNINAMDYTSVTYITQARAPKRCQNDDHLKRNIEEVDKT